MTNHWIDIQWSDVILIMGANPASNHPVSFKWITKAIERGARLICVDPRFTQSAAKSHVYAALRSGTDIAFLGGMIKYILDNDLIHKEYVENYTNAACMVNPDFKLSGDNNGVFSGLIDTRYDKKTWSYQKDAAGMIKKDRTLSDPNCVFQLLKRHYSRYNLDVVSRITGTPGEKLLQVYKEFSGTSQPGKAGTVLYAMGWTQHSVGTQNIRTFSIIQMLLGNMGIAGGGINALRGESNVQGSTDFGLLFDILPGYLKTPLASQAALKTYNKENTPVSKEPGSLNWMKHFPNYSASLLRSFYGMNASLEESYSYLPKIDDGENYSWLVLFDEMYKGRFTGFFAWGQNPACSGASSNKLRRALARLDWMVNVNLFDNETGSFWRGPGMDPARIGTEVFMLPCACSTEKEGSVTNSGRWMQWRYKAHHSPGAAMADAEMITELYYKIKDLYEKEGGPLKEAITKLTWNYGPMGADGRIRQVDTHFIAREINGYFLSDAVVEDKGTKRVFKKGALVPGFAFLRDDGTTSSGCWIYCGSYTDAGNMAARRDIKDSSGIGLYSGWAWSWPLNRRIIYNGASVDLNGRPWDLKHPVIMWDGSKWAGDVPDGAGDPGSGRPPFIMKPDGIGSIFGPGMADGPFPEHYEPIECPVEKNLLSPQKNNPIAKRWDLLGFATEYDSIASCDPRFPFVCSTYRIPEHWQTGVMTRWAAWLAEMQPDLFLEIGEVLAKERGIANGQRVLVRSSRGEVEAVALVTKRFEPFNIDGNTVHQVGILWHYGWATTAARKYEKNDGKPEIFTTGDSANLLTPYAGDPNTLIPETKAFMVNVINKAR